MMDDPRKPVLVLGANPAWQKTVVCERLNPGEVVRVKLEATGAAGKGFNTARAVRAFGVPVVLVSAAGPDAAEWEAACRAEGLETRFFPIDGSVRTATTIRDLSARAVTEIVEEGPAAADGALEILLAAMAEESARSCMLVVAGTFPPGLDTRRALDQLSTLTIPVVIDSVPAVRGLRELERVPANLMVKLNESEWKSVFQEENLDSAIADARRLWPRASLLATRGERGALLSCPGKHSQILTSEPFEVDAEINPIGAGDAFTGGYAVAICRGVSILEAALHGMAVARASCLNRLPARFSMEEVAVSTDLVRCEPQDA
jgi:fructose-1-phosphate kinase PfkB-like protein